MRSTPRRTSRSPSQSWTAAQCVSISACATTCCACRRSPTGRGSGASSAWSTSPSECAGSVETISVSRPRGGEPARGRGGDRRLADAALAGVSGSCGAPWGSAALLAAARGDEHTRLLGARGCELASARGVRRSLTGGAGGAREPPRSPGGMARAACTTARTGPLGPEASSASVIAVPPSSRAVSVTSERYSRTGMLPPITRVAERPPGLEAHDLLLVAHPAR